MLSMERRVKEGWVTMIDLARVDLPAPGDG
jgi:hypothetical protein